MESRQGTGKQGKAAAFSTASQEYIALARLHGAVHSPHVSAGCDDYAASHRRVILNLHLKACHVGQTQKAVEKQVKTAACRLGLFQ